MAIVAQAGLLLPTPPCRAFARATWVVALSPSEKESQRLQEGSAVGVVAPYSARLRYYPCETRYAIDRPMLPQSVDFLMAFDVATCCVTIVGSLGETALQIYCKRSRGI